jgi:SRSO17 transposase
LGQVLYAARVTTGPARALLRRLGLFLDGFSGCFSRQPQREAATQYIDGLFNDSERKSMQAMHGRLGEPRDYQALQHFITHSPWDAGRVWAHLRTVVPVRTGILALDDTGFPKQGTQSPGVQRQYCGALGKVENCQVGVFAAYASRHGYALVDKRLFMPEPWFTDAYARRRTHCQVPDDQGFQTKPQLAAAMLRALRNEGVLPFKYVVADGLYGHSPAFLEAVEEEASTIYFVSIPADTRCWLQGPVMATKQYGYRGERRTKRVVAATAKEPMAVEVVAKSLHTCFWYRRKVSEGTKGPIEYELTTRQVTLCCDGLPTKTVWLVMKRTVEEHPSSWYYISNAPVSARLPLFVWLSGVRWAIEQCFEEAKTELGLDQYEVRKYAGWHHHMLTTMLAHFFLWHLQIRLGKKSPSYYGVPAEDFVGGGVALQKLDHRGRPSTGSRETTA